MLFVICVFQKAVLILNNTSQHLLMMLNCFSYKLNFKKIVSTSCLRDESSRKAKATIHRERKLNIKPDREGKHTHMRASDCFSPSGLLSYGS